MGRLKDLGGESIDAVYHGRTFRYYGPRCSPIWLVAGIRNRAAEVRASKWETIGNPAEDIDAAGQVYNTSRDPKDYAAVALVVVTGVWGRTADRPGCEGTVIRCGFNGPLYSETHQIAGGRQLPNVLGLQEAVELKIAQHWPNWTEDVPGPGGPRAASDTESLLEWAMGRDEQAVRGEVADAEVAARAADTDTHEMGGES